jgi:uncharacterized protein (DUF983 family)
VTGSDLLASLVHHKIIVVGLRLQCPHCRQATWYRLSGLDTIMRCDRCLQEFDFPSADPPRDVWAYRANGPFAVENFAHGAYCVGLALQFIQEKIADRATWVPSMCIKDEAGTELEVDFAMFLKPRILSQIAEPFVVFGECKTFDEFKRKDIARMADLGKRFPGSVLCFATLNSKLTTQERNAIAQVARKGRRILRTGQQVNPVLVLTGAELLGEQASESMAGRFPERFRAQLSNLFMRGDIQEICDFSVQAHLGMESIYEWSSTKSSIKRHRRAPQSPTAQDRNKTNS